MMLQKTNQVACHIRVRDVAQAAAGQLYESMMGNNGFYETWKKQNPGCTPKQLEARFIDRNWPKCLDFARATLAVMLRQPDISDKMKEEVVDILHKDQLLRHKVGAVN